jgi:hypothetical protein
MREATTIIIVRLKENSFEVRTYMTPSTANSDDDGTPHREPMQRIGSALCG